MEITTSTREIYIVKFCNSYTDPILMYNKFSKNPCET